MFTLVGFAQRIKNVLANRPSLRLRGAQLSYSGEHFERWIAYLDSLKETDRDRIASLYEAPTSEASGLGTYLCDNADRVCQIVDDLLIDEDARALLSEIALDHDLEVPILPSPLRARKLLVKLGLLADVKGTHTSFPGVWSAILTPLLLGTRTSLLTLLGGCTVEELDLMTNAWEITGCDGRMASIFALANTIGQPEALAEIIARLPDMDYLGAAMVAIELGGVCFWQEVFGYELNTPNVDPVDAKVVPFMRRDERAMERDIAETLVSLGVVFRIDEQDISMLVVPEELWQQVWDLGRTWLLDWVADTYEGVGLTAQRRDDAARGDLQSTLKWLVIESEAGELVWSADKLTPETLTRLQQVGGHDASHWVQNVELAMQLGLFKVDGKRLLSNPAFETTLDLPKAAFVRHVLFEWCTGFVGTHVDKNLAKAVGLDDVWRRLMLKVLSRAKEFTPVWMRYEGVEPLLTGAGCLRDVEDSSEELLIAELGIVNGVIWTAKLVFLDLVSMLGTDYWYSKKAIAELFQIVASFSTFSHIYQVLEHPEMGLYVPVQRASFMTDPLHTPEFESWVDDLITHLLEPLGIARRHPETDSIWLDTTLLRIPSPPGLLDEHRQGLVRDLFSDPDVEFKIPGPSLTRLHRVPSATDPGVVDLDLPLFAVRQSLDGRAVTAFDGQRLRLD